MTYGAARVGKMARMTAADGGGAGANKYRRAQSYISDDEVCMEYETYSKYPNVIFQVKHFPIDQRQGEAVSQTISANFLKEFLVDPLVVPAQKAPNVF